MLVCWKMFKFWLEIQHMPRHVAKRILLLVFLILSANNCHYSFQKKLKFRRFKTKLSIAIDFLQQYGAPKKWIHFSYSLCTASVYSFNYSVRIQFKHYTFGLFRFPKGLLMVSFCIQTWLERLCTFSKHFRFIFGCF